MTKVNPNTSRLAAALTADLVEVINAKSATYARPENAAVVPEALITLLAVTIGTNYKRSGHAELVRLTCEKLAELVEDAYTLRHVFKSLDAKMGEAAERQVADDDADPAASLSPETKAQIDALMASLIGTSRPH